MLKSQSIYTMQLANKLQVHWEKFSIYFSCPVLCKPHTIIFLPFPSINFAPFNTWFFSIISCTLLSCQVFLPSEQLLKHENLCYKLDLICGSSKKHVADKKRSILWMIWVYPW